MLRMQTRVEPKVTPQVQPAPTVTPDIDPDRRLNPDRLCPAQKQDIVKKISDI